MKKYKKTYAIHTLAEKHTTFHLGKTKVRVSFTGGQVTKNGVTPATFTTADPIVQLAIENSADFKKGAVTLHTQYAVAGEVKIGMNPPEPGKVAPKEEAPVSDMTDPVPVGEPDPPAPTPVQEEAPESNLEVVEVSCKDVAKQYLQDHFGERPAPLRTWADVQECAAKHGVTFISPTLE